MLSGLKAVQRSPIRATPPASGSKLTAWEQSLRRSSLRAHSTEKQPTSGLSLLNRFDAAAMPRYPLSPSLLLDMKRRSESVESILKASSLTASKKKKARSLKNIIGKLKDNVVRLKDKRINGLTDLKDDLKVWLDEAMDIDKQTSKVEQANRRKKEAIAELNRQLESEARRLETLTASQVRVEAEIAQLISSAALITPVDKTASVIALFDHEAECKEEGEKKIEKLLAEKRILERKIRDLAIVGQEVG